MGTRNLEGNGSERNEKLNDEERILEEKEEESERESDLRPDRRPPRPFE